METVITKTRKNRISKKQRTECFLAALPDLLEGAKKYKHVKIETTDGYQKRQD